MTTLFPDFGLDETGTKGRRPARPSLEATGQARLRPPSSRRASTEPRLLTNPSPAGSELILAQADDGPTPMQYRFEDDTLWRSQAQMAELFQVTTQNVTRHLNEIFAEDDLGEEAKGTLRNLPGEHAATRAQPTAQSSLAMITPEAPSSEFVLRQTDDGQMRIACRLEDETLCLPQALIADLFEIRRRHRTPPLEGNLRGGEARPRGNCSRLSNSSNRRSRTLRIIDHYNLEAMLKSKAERGTGLIEGVAGAGTRGSELARVRDAFFPRLLFGEIRVGSTERAVEVVA